jgi:hypothetical protein
MLLKQVAGTLMNAVEEMESGCIHLGATLTGIVGAIRAMDVGMEVKSSVD